MNERMKTIRSIASEWQDAECALQMLLHDNSRQESRKRRFMVAAFTFVMVVLPSGGAAFSIM